MEIGTVDYSSVFTPDGYKCGKCGATHCKLWREYNTFLDHQTLYCALCAGKDQDADVSDIDPAGMVSWWFTDQNGIKEEMGRVDQIGNLVPAVPTEEGDTFWGYSSVPQPGCEWWYRLPSVPSTQKLLE